MEESVRAFPFRKLRYNKFLTLEVMMFIDHPEAYKFMFSVNKAMRIFFQQNIMTIQNGFINDGLIDYEFDHYFHSF
jgi:hypothetical protein